MNTIKTALISMFLFVATNTQAQKENLEDSVGKYYGLQDFGRAKYFAEKSIEQTKILGDTSGDYTNAINNLGVVYYGMSNFKLALETYLKALDLEHKRNIPPTESFANLLLNIGNTYNSLNLYAQAEKYDMEAIALFKKLSIENEDYVTLLNNIANLYDNVRESEKSKEYYKQAIATTKKLSGENSLTYALLLNNFGALLTNDEKFKEAEEYLFKCLAIRKKLLGENHPDYAFTLANIGSLYDRLDLINEAVPFTKQALEIRKNKLGIKHPDYSSSLNNLAVLYQKLHKYATSDSLQNFAIEIAQDVYGVNSRQYLLSLSNKGLTNQQAGNFAIADSLYNIVKKYYENNNQKTNSGYALCLLNLSSLHFEKQDYEQAINYGKTAIEITEKNSGKQSSNYLLLSHLLASVYLSTHNYQDAETYSTNHISLQNDLLFSNLEFLSQSELLSYLTKRKKYFDLPFSILNKKYSSSLVKTAYNNRLLFSTVALLNTAGLNKQMEQAKDSIITENWNEYKITKALLSKMLVLPFSKRKFNTDSLVACSNRQEKQLLRQSANYRNIKENLTITWQDVKTHLKQGEVAIEFVRYSHFNKVFTDTNYYAAMLVTPTDTAPIFVNLIEEKKLQNAINTFAYKGNTRGNNNAAIVPLNNIYNLLLKSLEKYLKHTQTIYFVPDGLLHQVSFAAIPYKKDSLLCDKYKLVQLTSTKQIVLNKQQEKVNYIALFGGINYNKQLFDSTTTTAHNFYNYASKRGSTTITNFNYLPHTLTEVKGIEKTMTQLHKNVVVSTKEKATEAMFKSLGGNQSPQVIHFATHGFTLPKLENTTKGEPTNAFIASNNPLLRCGLVMAGGNIGWKGKNNANEDDGILTGEEISNVPLPNTQLVVLSACETGLGKLQGSEGVFGLQRAFKIAGANYVMASLWQIPDKETAEFMQVFYATWLKGKSINIDEAFIKTQRTMRLKYPPYYWAGITLVH